ncbi:antibiotic biosynthesis monooxygenase [Stieleria sp. TO1_6]|uniref:antibiotic biosynthesis monooxygenase n=1 Tax=Stieleria tagensis TaxID=2956795 RepID=UPI00209B7241|nr:antibiotic biosynthesis monooxygenase [Stieleria tagensis]MCO8120976.1 antibiotic biosynthesis monooxygenase [Stieleria tagensis]
MNSTDPNGHRSKATIFATAFPAAGKERQWEQAIGDLIRTASTFPGHQGSIFLRPESSDQTHYRVITKFDTVENMQRWYNSDERQEKVSQLEPFQQQPAEIQHLTGFEPWFTPPGDAPALVAAPPKYKMFVVVWIAVYATVLPLIGVLKPMTVSLPKLASSALLAAITVAMMTWIVMPLLTWLLSSWLYPSNQPRPDE